MEKSLVVYNPALMAGLFPFACRMRYVGDGIDEEEQRKVLLDASLVFDAIVRVHTRKVFYISLLDGASALLDRYGEAIGTHESDKRLRYAVKCCEAAKGRLFKKLVQEMQRVPGRVSTRKMYRDFGIDPDGMEWMSELNWQPLWSSCMRNAICMCERNTDPPFMNPCFRDKTCLVPASDWRGDDGNYDPVGD
jgi:hypothetical protein